MPINIISASYSDQYTGIHSGGTDTGSSYLVGAVNDLMWLDVNFNIVWNTLDIPMYFTASTITRMDQGSFVSDDFKVGDSFTVLNTTSNNGSYIIKSLTPTTITTTASFVGALEASVNIWGTTPIKALDFYYNLIQNGNQQTFNSLSDPTSVQKLTANWTGVTPSNQALNPVGISRAWWEGLNTTITQTNTGGFTQSFSITHNFQIKPWFLSGQQLSQGIPPKYFQNANCLQHIYQIVGRYSSTDPNQEHVSTNTSPLANTGWYGEFLNGGCENYIAGSVSYVNTFTGITVSSFDYNETESTNVTAVIKSPSGTFATGSKVNLQFSWLPNSQSVYQNVNCKNFASNINELLLTDSAMLTIGSASVNGINFGTPFGIINSATIIGSGHVATMSFSLSADSYVSSTLVANAPSNVNYLLTATPQEASVTTLLGTDRTAVILDINQAQTDPDNTNLLDYLSQIEFYRYPDVDINPVTNLSMFVGDYAYATLNFGIYSGALGNANMLDFNVYIVATNAQPGAQGSEFVLDRWNLITSNVFNGTDNEVYVAQNRGYALPQGSIQNIRSLQRNSTLDIHNYVGYQMIYGFQADYRYYLSVNGTPQEFVNSNWSNFSTYNNLPGWSLQFKTVIDVQDPETGLTTQFVRYAPLQVNDQTNIQNTVTITYDTYDANGNDLQGLISNGQQTEVVWTFYGTASFATIPVGYDGYQAQLYFNYNNGTKMVYDMDDTESTPIGLWVGQPIITYIDENTIQVSGILDLTGQNILNYRLYVKLGYTTEPTPPLTPSNFLFNETAGVFYFNEDGTPVLLENNI